MKRNNYILISTGIICACLFTAFIINILFKIKSDSIFSAEWSAGDALNYAGTMIGAASTFVLSLIAYKQNEKLQKLEDNNYIATNGCMVLIKEILIKPKASIPVNYELHDEQILCEDENTDKKMLGYGIEINLKKIDEAIQGIPSLIYVRKCTMFLANKDDSIKSAIWAENIRDGYTRMAIRDSGMAFKCTILISKNKKKEFERDIQGLDNCLHIDFEFDIITDKYVMTKCKSRACCNAQNNKGIISWNSSDAMVFFYGHEIKYANDIKVLNEE